MNGMFQNITRRWKDITQREKPSESADNSAQLFKKLFTDNKK